MVQMRDEETGVLYVKIGRHGHNHSAMQGYEHGEHNEIVK